MKAPNLSLRLIAAGLSLALAACGTAPETPSDEPTQTMMPVEPDGGIGDGAGPPPALVSAAIPVRFHGVWDFTGGTCARESDLRMEISSNEIMFYESIGAVTAVTDEGDDVILTLAMEGEGEMWEQKTRLSLVDDGNAQLLQTSDGALPKTTGDYPRKRCS